MELKVTAVEGNGDSRVMVALPEGSSTMVMAALQIATGFTLSIKSGSV